MDDFVTLDAYHRFVSVHNRDEPDKVEHSMEVWGGEAKVLAGGLKVQAFPYGNSKRNSYSFGTEVPGHAVYGFRDNVRVIREVVWRIDMPGVEERENGNFAAIPITWIKRPAP